MASSTERRIDVNPVQVGQQRSTAGCESTERCSPASGDERRTFTFNELLERELSGDSGRPPASESTFVFCEPRCVPDSKCAPMPSNIRSRSIVRTRPQLSRHQQATGAIEIDVSGVAEQEALQCACRVRQLRDLLAAHFPCRRG